MNRTWVGAVLFFLAATSLWAATSADYYAAGTQLYRQAQYAKSIQYLKAAVQLNPQNWQAYQVMGQAYYQLGDKSDAVAMMDQSLNINPNNPGLRQFRDRLAGSSTGSGSTSNQLGPGQPNSLGLGLEIGDPGSWGVSGKYWLDHTSALQPTVKIGAGTVLQMDYLLHDYGLLHSQNGSMPVYFGLGGGAAVGGGIAFEARGVVGLSYIFPKSVPLDIYVQVVPAFWFGGGGISGLQVYGNVGSRFYF